MTQQQQISRFPTGFSASTEHKELRYVRKEGYYAVPSWQAVPEAPQPVTIFAEGDIAVFKGDPAKASAHNGQPLLAVYALEPAGDIAVPTGRVFLRFAEGTDALSQQASVQRAGYVIENTLSYAPNAAWVRNRSGDVAEALNGLEALAKLPGVKNVEPQMLSNRASRV
jgi:hypothetical protein